MTIIETKSIKNLRIEVVFQTYFQGSEIFTIRLIHITECLGWDLGLIWVSFWGIPYLLIHITEISTFIRCTDLKKLLAWSGSALFYMSFSRRINALINICSWKSSLQKWPGPNCWNLTASLVNKALHYQMHGMQMLCHLVRKYEEVLGGSLYPQKIVTYLILLC